MLSRPGRPHSASKGFSSTAAAAAAAPRRRARARAGATTAGRLGLEPTHAAARPPTARGRDSACRRTATSRAQATRRSIDRAGRRTRFRIRAPAPARRSDVGGVRSKKSGRVAVSRPASVPARPNSASHSSRCQRCSGSSHPAISAPFLQAASISGREYAYSSNSSASWAASCARRRSRARAVPVLGVEVATHRRQLRQRQPLAVVEQRQQLAFDHLAIDDAQPGRARLGDLAQELLEEAVLDVGGDAAPPRQPLLDVTLDVSVRNQQADGVVQRRLSWPPRSPPAHRAAAPTGWSMRDRSQTARRSPACLKLSLARVFSSP